MSRPKTKAAECRRHIISFRLNDAEFARLSQRASAAHLRVNELARQLVKSRVDNLTIKTTRQADPALINQLHHIGHNLNQITKRVHVNGHVSPHLDDLCRRIGELMDDALSGDT